MKEEIKLFFDDSRSAETQSSYLEHFKNPTINGDSDWATGLMTGILCAAAVKKSAPKTDASEVTYFENENQSPS